jgi:hemoglobin
MSTSVGESDAVEALILDLLEWIGPEPRPYAEVLDAWRTSCPRLPVWEEATDRGFIARRRGQGAALVAVTAAGAEHLRRHRLRPTLFEFAGGEPAFLALARAHHERCLADPELNHPFTRPDQHPQHVERLAAYWAEVLGGPPTYSTTCGGEQSALLLMHAHNGEMGDLGERFVRCFEQAMDDAELPGDPQFRAAMSAYMRWAVDDVLVYAPKDAVVPAGEAIPHWGWDGLQAS